MFIIRIIIIIIIDRLISDPTCLPIASFIYFLNFYQLDSSIYSYHLILKFWINFSTVQTLTYIYYTLYRLFLFCCVINNRIHSVFWFEYSLQLSCGLMWYHYTVCSVYTIHFTMCYWSIAFFFFNSNIVCNYHVGWCDITSIPTFVIML